MLEADDGAGGEVGGGGGDAPPHTRTHHLEVDFQAVLRIRPLACCRRSSSERDDPIVLEPPHHHPGGAAGGSSSPADPAGVAAAAVAVLHPIPTAPPPPPPPAADDEFLSPSSALVRQTVVDHCQRQREESSTAAAGTAAAAAAVEEQHDVEYTFDRVFSSATSDSTGEIVGADQERVYYALGLPAALSAMEPLRSYDPSESFGTRVAGKTNHLFVCVGSAGGGRTHTCLGGGGDLRKRNDTDGLIPRIVDSLFSQSRHHLPAASSVAASSSSKTTRCRFALNVRAVQVNQRKSRGNKATATSGHGIDDCDVHDLLHPAPSSTSRSPFSSLMKKKTATATATASVSSSSAASSSAAGSGITTAATKSPIIGNLKSMVVGHPDASSSAAADYFRSTEEEGCGGGGGGGFFNGKSRTCRSANEAREALHAATRQSSRISNSRKFESHLLIQLTPVLLVVAGETAESRQHHRVVEGGTVAVLDMSAFNGGGGGGVSSWSAKTTSRSSSSRRQASVIVSERNDTAHAAMIRCLDTHQQNAEILRENNNNKCKRPPTVTRCASLKKVPYRQHTVTMLVQPIFRGVGGSGGGSAGCGGGGGADRVEVTVLLAAYPGHRDYGDKRRLLEDVSKFRGGPPSRPVTTGLVADASSPCKQQHQQHHSQKRSTPSKKKKRRDRSRKDRKGGGIECSKAASDADDEGSHNYSNNKKIGNGTKRSSGGRRRELSPMQVPTEIVSPNPVAVAPGRTVGNNGGGHRGGGIDISPTADGAYPADLSTLGCGGDIEGNRDDDDDDGGYAAFEPLPPPVAPSYVDQLPRQQHSHHRNRHHSHRHRASSCSSVATAGASAEDSDVVMHGYASGGNAGGPSASSSFDYYFGGADRHSSNKNNSNSSFMFSPASVQMVMSEESGPPPPPMPGLYRPDMAAAAGVAADNPSMPPAPPQPSAPTFSDDAAAGSTNYNRLFASPMKTLNKAVRASKKKGQRVMEKVGQFTTTTTTTFLDYRAATGNGDEGGDGRLDGNDDYQLCNADSGTVCGIDADEDGDDFGHGGRRGGPDSIQMAARKVKSLESENERVVQENESLRNKNELLERELDQLRERLRLSGKNEEEEQQRRQEPSSGSPLDRSNDNDNASVASRDDDWESFRKEQRNNLVDSCLLEHMANIGGGGGGGGGILGGKTSSALNRHRSPADSPKRDDLSHRHYHHHDRGSTPTSTSSPPWRTPPTLSSFPLNYPSNFQRAGGSGGWEARDDSL